MEKAQEVITYQRFINNEFLGRRVRNPNYSLRAFARDLGIAPPKLSEILRGKCGLSESSATKMALELSLSETESKIFINQVIVKHARKKSEREAAKIILDSLEAQHLFNEITLDTFKIISDWQHFAILELTEIKSFQSNSSWIARRLKISEELAGESLRRLFSLGLLSENSKGEWIQTEAILATPSGIPSSEIKNHHRNILAKAEAALFLAVEERDFSSVTLAVPESMVDEIKKDIKEFRRKLAKKINEASDKDRVYCLSTQFFPLDNKEDTNVH